MKTIVVMIVLFIGLAGCGTSSATIKHIPYGVEPTSLRFECKGKCPGFHSSLVNDPTLTATIYDHLIAIPDDTGYLCGSPAIPVNRPTPDYYMMTFLKDDAVGIQVSIRPGLKCSGGASWQYNQKSLDATFIELFDQLYAKTQGVPFPTPTSLTP